MNEYKPTIADALTFFGYSGFSCNSDPASENEFNYQSCNETVLTHSWSQLKTKWDELITEWEAQEYARNRASAFPSTGEQFDMQYWDQVNGTTTWKDAMAKVKSDNPKPE